MDTAWIQVFVLSLSECVAPAGKTVCQQQEARYQFYDEADCEAVLQELLEYKSMAENVIVDKGKTRCQPTIRQSPTFASLNEANQALGDAEVLEESPAGEQETEPSSEEHQARLEKLPECNAAQSVTPCKIGPIIVESDASKEVPVWRRDEDD